LRVTITGNFSAAARALSIRESTAFQSVRLPMLSSIRARRKKWRVTPSMISRLSNKALKSIVASMPAAFLIESLKLGNVSAKGVFIE